MINSAKEHEWPYYFEETYASKQHQVIVCDSAFVPKNIKILLWYFRMGLPNFQYLKHVFPSIFMNKKSIGIQCETCEFAKHQCTSFSTSIYKNSKPFNMIHCDLWVPS